MSKSYMLNISRGWECAINSPENSPLHKIESNNIAAKILRVNIKLVRYFLNSKMIKLFEISKVYKENAVDPWTSTTHKEEVKRKTEMKEKNLKDWWRIPWWHTRLCVTLTSRSNSYIQEERQEHQVLTNQILFQHRSGTTFLLLSSCILQMYLIVQ